MSNKSGTSSQVITLPKGGGALHGIGEKFSPDLHTGTGNFTVPIALPPGRNGFQPQLNLVYSTGSGNGPYGLGWSLSIPGVGRQTARGIPQYDSEDIFVLSGTEDLVPVNATAISTQYRPRTEGLFARIYHHHNPGSHDDYWEVRSKDGLVSYYGTAGQASSDPTVIANPDPSKREQVFAWKLSRTEDPFGNRIEYEYMRDLGQDGPHRWDQLYLSQIRYGDYGNPGQTQFLISVTFTYEESAEQPEYRPDAFSDYRAGFEIRTRKRCKRIEIRTHADEVRLARTYQFIYLDQREDLADLDQRLPLNGVSLLSQIRVVGHDGNKTEELPPLEFGYTQFEPQARDFFPATGTDLPARSLASPDLELADLFGNGLPDVLEMNGTVRYWRNLGGGQFDLPRPMRDAPAGLALADPGVQLIDADGDGRIDLLATLDGLSGYFPLHFGGLWDRRSFQRYRLAPSFNLEDPEVKLVDLDGNGITDAIRSGSRLECFFNDPKEGWNNTRWVERQDIELFPNINFSDPRVKWADMTGDGLQDIVLVYDGNVEYWPNLGYGNWARRIHLHHSPRFPYGYDPKRILVGDVDGDGLADLVYVDDTQVTLWINQSGNGWSAPITIQGTPPVADMDAVRLVDLLGAGISGVLWSADANGLSHTNMFFLDFTGGSKPYLLNVMDNHMGAVTRVGYAPSTRFYLEDQKQPATRWQTPLPFPVQVVARVEVIDALSDGKLTTEYRYHHGYWDGAEREFRGFGMVDQFDTETFETYHAPGLHGEEAGFSAIAEVHFSPPTLTKTWFHQGPIGDEFGEWKETDFSGEFWLNDPQVLTRPSAMIDFLKRLPRRMKRDALRTLRGTILRTELYALDGTQRQDRPYTVTESLPGVTSLPVGDPWVDKADEWPEQVFFPHTLASRTTQWERGDDLLTQFSFSGDYDKYGQPRSQITIAVPRGRHYSLPVSSAAQPPEPYLATHTLTDYAQVNTEQHYIVNRVARTTAFEIKNDGRASLFALRQQIDKKTVDGVLVQDRPIIGQTLNFYDGVAFQGLPFGQIGDYGAPVRTESLVLTQAILHDAYKSGNDVQNPPETPPYLTPDGSLAWPAEYPQEFRALLPPLAGYTYHAGGAGSLYIAGYFVTTERRSYDFHAPGESQRGLVKITRDPLGNDTQIAFDAFDLLPTMVTDATALTTQAVYDYRVMQPSQVTDPNGNRTAFAFTPLGLLDSTAAMGKDGENIGDTLAVPGSQLIYDFHAFADHGQPISVSTIRRIHHTSDIDVPLTTRDETIRSMEYSDGFGRLLQTRTQAEDIIFGDPIFGSAVLPADQAVNPGDAVGQPAPTDQPRVVVSGWQIFDNKGQVVEKYEPFFSSGWDYAPPADEQFGQKATLFYNPRGQVIRTLNPDGSEQRVIYGVPISLARPEQFTPTSWEVYTYDANDNAGRTHPAKSLSYQAHWNTPASTLVDALGRTVQTVERNGPDPMQDWFTTRSTYDIQGNLLTVTDALGRVAFTYVYDLAKHPLRIESIDAGVRRIVLNALSNPVEGHDSKGALVLHAYDQVNRPLRLWARDNPSSAITLRERLEYGDGGDPQQPMAEREANRQLNRLGKLYNHHDEAGLMTATEYDFKGNLLEKVRQVIGDAAILAVFNPPPPNWQVSAFRVDWQSPNAGDQLDSTEYHTSLTYDALNRVKTMRYPQDVDGQRKELRPHYNRAGALERVELDGEIYVEQIAYNAKGQRSLIAYANSIMTRHAYDPQTFRLVRLRTERYAKLDDFTYHPTAPTQPLQDFAYAYDLAGNILALHDRTPNSGVLNTPLGLAGLDRAFTYDPLYRLFSATGREQATMPPTPPWMNTIKSQDATLTRRYTEQYQYDAVGNLQELQHQAEGGNFTRGFTLTLGNNRLTSMTVGAANSAYTYDTNGNLSQENTERHFEWDYADQLCIFRTQTGNAEPSIYAHYVYDAGGQRVKKLVRKQGGSFEVTVYSDGIFEHRRSGEGGALQENNTLHVIDNQSRIALVRVGVAFPDDTTPAVKFHLGDHLGSSSLVIGSDGAWINREEYTPYGETSFGSFARKCYRFTGQERDEESGLYYHGARYYVPWLARWVSCDPAGISAGINAYRYASSNPIHRVDPSGTQDAPIDMCVEPPAPEASGYDPNAIDPSYSNYGQSPGELSSIDEVNPQEPFSSPELNNFYLGGEPIVDGPSPITLDFQEPAAMEPVNTPWYLSPESVEAGETASAQADILGLAAGIIQGVAEGGLQFSGIRINGEWNVKPLGTNWGFAAMAEGPANVLGGIAGGVNVMGGIQTLLNPEKGMLDKTIASLNVFSGTVSVLGVISTEISAGGSAGLAATVSGEGASIVGVGAWGGRAAALGSLGAVVGAGTAGYTVGTLLAEHTVLGEGAIGLAGLIDTTLTGQGERSALLRMAEWFDTAYFISTMILRPRYYF